MTELSPRPTAKRRWSLGLTAALCTVFVACMVGMSFAAVPLYRMFCQLTGYGGTTRQATAAPAQTGERVVTVRFDSNIANGLGWSFRPLQREMKVRLGEVGEVVFQAQNKAARAATGRAVFNVTPDAVGAYFNKIACFCFTDQTLAPGGTADFGVTFFVDPAYADDPELATITTITLSYTFFPATTGEARNTALPPAAAGGETPHSL
jgi:cytochrome c oxidase assembly protein subunit 11